MGNKQLNKYHVICLITVFLTPAHSLLVYFAPSVRAQHSNGEVQKKEKEYVKQISNLSKNFVTDKSFNIAHYIMPDQSRVSQMADLRGLEASAGMP